VRTAAAEIAVAVTAPRDVALAAPVSTSAALANSGTGAITAGVVVDIGNPAFQAPPGQLSPEVLIRFTGPASYEVLDKVTLATIDTGTYDPASGEEIFPTENLNLDFGYRVRITGTPVAGDEFSVAYNTGGTGDNRNALLLAGLQGERLMDGGSSTFADAYGLLVARVGSDTRRAQNSSESQLGLLQQSQGARAAASGVNLDEEAADLLRFQQAYQAAAQIISVADQLFGTLISAIRR
jgi:flagellar hook-associated protein 1 FlgK